MTHDQHEVLLNIFFKFSLGQVLGTTSLNQVGSFSTIGNPLVERKHNDTHFYLHNFTFGYWLIDSRTSDHICGYVHWFHSYHEINPLMLNYQMLNFSLPNVHQNLVYQMYCIFLNFH